MARRRLGTILLASAGALLLADQIVQHTALRDGYLSGRRIAPFDPPIFTAEQGAALERMRAEAAAGRSLPGLISKFDPALGWTTSQEVGGGGVFDWAGSRIARAPLPRERAPGRRRAVAVGDSFVLGSEVGPLECWTAQLEEFEKGLEVANLGSVGYGSDQALMRLERDGVALRPDEVWLGFLPSAAERVVSVCVQNYAHLTMTPGFKPRFLLDETGSLRLLPNPAATLARAVELLDSQVQFFAAVGEHDEWVRRTPAAYAPDGSSWFHRFAAGRIWLTQRDARDRSAKAALLDPGSEVYRLHRAIVLRAGELARSAGASFLFVILPERQGLEDRARNGRGYWQGLVDDLRSHGVAVLDCAPDLQAAGGAQDPSLWAPIGHYSARGNRIVAEAIAKRGR